jgi:hypothetical protein
VSADTISGRGRSLVRLAATRACARLWESLDKTSDGDASWDRYDAFTRLIGPSDVAAVVSVAEIADSRKGGTG